MAARNAFNGGGSRRYYVTNGSIYGDSHIIRSKKIKFFVLYWITFYECRCLLVSKRSNLVGRFTSHILKKKKKKKDQTFALYVVRYRPRLRRKAMPNPVTAVQPK